MQHRDDRRPRKRFVADASPALLRAAYALTGQPQAAEDPVQTAFERAA